MLTVGLIFLFFSFLPCGGGGVKEGGIWSAAEVDVTNTAILTDVRMPKCQHTQKSDPVKNSDILSGEL